MRRQENLAKIKNAGSEEFDHEAGEKRFEPVVYHLKEWVEGNRTVARAVTDDKGGTMRLGAYNATLAEGSKVAGVYGDTAISERHRHRYEVDIKYRKQLEDCGLVFSGMSPDGKLPEIVEVADHPWYIGVQYHPELKSKPFKPHPLFREFVKAALEQKPLGIMPDLATLSLFAVACLALTITPGPDMLLIASRSAVQGRMAGLATYLGVAAGSYIHAIAAALGLSQLFIALPAAYDVVRYAGALYLLYLGYKAFTSKPQPQSALQTRPTISFQKMFIQGMLTNILNPKVIIFVLALYPQFIKPELGSVTLQFMVLATELNIIGFFVNGTVIIAATSMGTFFANSTGFGRISQYFLGTVFVGLAAKLAFDARG